MEERLDVGNMLQLSNVTKNYYKNKKEVVEVLKNVNFNINSGEILGLVGDSGSGKSTIGQIICGLVNKTDGKIIFKGEEVKYPMEKKFKKSIQILFQHPEVAFNPKLKIYDSIKEPYILYKENWKREDIILDIEKLSLKKEYLERYPNELSGGELQRLALARVLVTKPDILVLDEPTSMLDVISQAQIIDILREYQKENNTSYLFISHHIALAKQFCNRIIKIENGFVDSF